MLTKMVECFKSDGNISVYQMRNRPTLFMPFKIRKNEANQAINAIQVFSENNEVSSKECKEFESCLSKSSPCSEIAASYEVSKHAGRTRLRAMRRDKSKAREQYKGNNKLMNISPSTNSDSTGSDMLSNIAFDLKPLCESLPKLKVTTPNLLHDEVAGAFSLYAKSKENKLNASNDYFLETDPSASLYCSELDFPSDADASVCSYDSSVTISSVESLPRNFYDPKVHRVMAPNHGFIVVPVPKLLHSERNKWLRDNNTSPTNKNISHGEHISKPLNTSRAMIRLVFPSPSKISKSSISHSISSSALSKCANVAENLLQMNTRRKVKRQWEQSQENIIQLNVLNQSREEDMDFMKKSCYRATPNLFRVPSPPPPKRLLRSRKNVAQPPKPMNEEEANALYNAVDEYLMREKLEREHNIKHWLLEGQSRKTSKIPGHFPVHPMKTRSSSKFDPAFNSCLHNIQKNMSTTNNKFKVKRLDASSKKNNPLFK